MSDITFVSTRPDLLRPAKRFLRGVVAFFDAFDRAIQVSNRYEELSRMSDAELKRRGLARDGLVQKAWSDFN